MEDVNVLAIVAVTLGAFLISGVWYGIFSKVVATLSASKGKQAAAMGPVQVIVELGRSAVVATALALLLARLGADTAVSGVGYGVLLWGAFPVVLLAGSVMHERVSSQLAAIHSGDWLLKLVFMSAVLAVWR